MEGKVLITSARIILFVKVGDDDNAFERIQNAFENNQVATHARVIMVNPLHAQIPRAVVLLQASCNRFTHNEVLHQWLVLEDLCQTVLDPVLGPGIGHASDGDSRRRKIMLNHASLVNEGNPYQPVLLEDGFIMSAKIELTPLGKRVLRNLYDQGCIHNDKKIMNPLDHSTRILTLGRYTAHMNHLRLVMRVFPQIVHGLRLDDVNRRDRQKWEIVQRLKFKQVLQCLMDIFEGTGEIVKDVSVLRTWAYLYVAWHYIEIFFSLHASLRERIKYAAFVVLLYCIWRNFIIRTNNLTLKRNFLTRECFQDVLLSCHYAVILISFFRDEYLELECPLHLTGTDCCESYFSENGSFVMNRHNYTFVDMHTNLGYMNRMQEIRVTNNELQFPKRKTNNDFIWDKQFDENQRKRTCDLKNYPSAADTIIAWKEGVKMAQSLAKRLGMHPDDEQRDNAESDEDDDDDDDKKWFHKATSFVEFDESLMEMVTEKEAETERETSQQEENLNSDEDRNLDSSLSRETEPLENEVVGDLRGIVNKLLDSICEPEDTGGTVQNTTEKEKHSPTILVPRIGRRYNSTVIAELRNNPTLLTDCLKRVKEASSLTVTNQTTTGTRTGSDVARKSHDLELFDDCAIYDKSTESMFFLGTVQRIRKKGKRGFLEYVIPISLKERQANIEILVTVYKKHNSETAHGHHLYEKTKDIVSVAISKVICGVELSIKDGDTDLFEMREEDLQIIKEFVENIQENRSATKHVNQSQNQSNQKSNLPDDGRRVDIVRTASGGKSKSVSHLFS